MEINLTNDKGEEKIITYEVIYKRVKNINLRFDANNNLVISAPRYVGRKEIEKVIREYTNWIFKSMKTNENKENASKVKFFLILLQKNLHIILLVLHILFLLMLLVIKVLH